MFPKILRHSLVPTVWALSGCVAEKPARPLCVGIAFSLGEKRVSMEHIETILELCQGRDCRLALNGIREFARPLTNVEITPVQGSFSERIQASQRNASEIARWKAEAAPILLSNQRPYRADLYGTLLRFGLFFSQNEEAEKTLILASKCVHTGPERLLPPFPEDVTILVVGAEHDTAKWVFGENVVTLDDMESALEILKLKARR